MSFFLPHKDTACFPLPVSEQVLTCYLLRVFLRYVLLQLPGTLLVGLVLSLLKGWLDFVGVLVGMGLALWVAKDLLLFPLFLRSYGGGGRSVADLVGARGFARAHDPIRGKPTRGMEAERVRGEERST